MKYRVFYAPQVQRTFEKLFILTNDGNLYCQYLNHGRKDKISESGFDYNSFKPNDYSWGKGVAGEKTLAGEANGAISNFQYCDKELTIEEAINILPSQYIQANYPHMISGQLRWIQSYLESRGLCISDWDSEIYSG